MNIRAVTFECRPEEVRTMVQKGGKKTVEILGARMVAALLGEPTQRDMTGLAFYGVEVVVETEITPQGL